MIRLERIGDLGRVREMIAAPGSWDAATDDTAPGAADWTPNADPRIWYVLASDADGPIGLYTLLPQSAVCWEIHCTRTFGVRAEKATRAIAPWIFERTTCRRLVCAIPVTNRLTWRHARRAGWLPYGANPRSFLKRGELIDQILLGISPEDL